jgi:hypothetical protein
MPPPNAKQGRVIVKRINFNHSFFGTVVLEALGRGYVIDGMGLEEVIFNTSHPLLSNPVQKRLPVIYLLYGKEADEYLILEREPEDYILAWYKREL